jgi:hypothetical protein
MRLFLTKKGAEIIEELKTQQKQSLQQEKEARPSDPALKTLNSEFMRSGDLRGSHKKSVNSKIQSLASDKGFSRSSFQEFCSRQAQEEELPRIAYSNLG